MSILAIVFWTFHWINGMIFFFCCEEIEIPLWLRYRRRSRPEAVDDKVEKKKSSKISIYYNFFFNIQFVSIENGVCPVHFAYVNELSPHNDNFRENPIQSHWKSFWLLPLSFVFVRAKAGLLAPQSAAHQIIESNNCMRTENTGIMNLSSATTTRRI